MDDIEKFFRKLSTKEYEALTLVFQQIQKDYTEIPGLTKLRGFKNLFRVRVGRIRIIFRVNKGGIDILRLAKTLHE
jgi:mRNA-degrading endonuclease RelE of RelBE toxin-antitoxin system